MHNNPAKSDKCGIYYKITTKKIIFYEVGLDFVSE